MPELIEPTCITFANVIAFAVNSIFFWGIGVFGLMNNVPDFSYLNTKYQTLVTPINRSYYIWFLIFASQAVFVIAQISIDRFKKSNFVHDRIGWMFAVACFLQAGWVIAFVYEIIWLTMLLVALLYFTVAMFVVNNVQFEYDDEGDKWTYWVLLFPFEVYCGWMTFVAFWNANVVIVNEQPGNEVLQLSVSILSLVVLQVVAALALFVPSKPQRFISLVTIWVCIGIKLELDAPSSTMISEMFSELITDALANVATGIAIITSGFILVCELKHNRKYAVKVEDETEEVAGHGGMA